MTQAAENIWSHSELEKELQTGDVPFYSFIDTKTMKVEIYEIPAGAVDLQTPHDLDELYYIASGRSKFKSESGIAEVKTGDIIFVKAHEPHRFLDITEDLTAIVFFSKMEPSS